MKPSMYAIRTSDLTKVYKTLGKRHCSLDGLNLEVGENEVYGFLGRNGAGKTTTIKLLCSLLKPTRGEAFVFDRSVRTPGARRAIGYLPETPYFYEYLTPRETLRFYGRLQGMRSKERAAEWEKLADLLDLRGIADDRIRGFSKGMRQRLAFAVALVGDPPLLVLDEPMSGLDPMGRRMMRNLILQLRDAGKTIFFSSHVLSDVEQICDRVGILVQGKLTVQGRLDELLTDKVRMVEVTLASLDQDAAQQLAARTGAQLTRQSEAGWHFTAPDLDASNELVRLAQQQGAKLVECAPVRESLEDYFMQKQEVAA